VTGRHWALLVTLTGATVLMPLNSTMFAVGIPSLLGDFDVSVAHGVWLVTAYLITMAAVHPVAGKLGDLYGYRRMFYAGLLIFLAASVGGAYAPSFSWLVVLRALQGMAGAVMGPNATAMLRFAVPAEYHGRAFGTVGALMGYGAAAGPPLGGMLISLFGWPAIFWVNVPVLLAIAAVGWRIIPVSESRPARFDLAGSLLLVVTLAAASLALTMLRQGTDRAWQAGVVALAAGLLFAVQERTHPEPVVEFRLFRHPAFAAANGSILLQNLMMYTILLLIPFFVQDLKGFTPVQTGLLLSVYSLMFALLAPVGGLLFERHGSRLPVTLSALLLGGSAAFLASAGAGTPTVLIVAYLLAGGIGVGISGPAIQLAALHAAPRESTGLASGMLTTSRYFGSIIGSLVIGLFGGQALTESAYHLIFAGLAGSGVILLLAARLLPASGGTVRSVSGGPGRP
jgi:EmrB/QacA subfamily drug resistance transporter